MSHTQNITSTLATYDAIRAAIQQRAPLSIVYATRGEVTKERVIRPIAIEVGKRGSDIVVAEDSLRKGIISLRIDRFVAMGAAVGQRV
jgi:predicted DNA-binding transcriptional regulator YafY